MAQFSNCLSIISRMSERDQDSLVTRLDELQAQGIPAQKAQVHAAIDVLMRAQADVAGIQRSAARDVTETPEFKRWSGGAPLVRLGETHEWRSGHPVVVEALHGTTNADLTQFRRDRASIESDFGAGFYSSSAPEDVAANYANNDGPDLTRRVERLAEQIAQDDEFEGDIDDAMVIARQSLSEDSPNTLKLYVSFKNPAVLGGKGETFFNYEESYIEEADEYGEPAGLLVDFINALDEAGDGLDVSMRDLENTKAKLFEEAAGDGLKFGDLARIVKEGMADTYSEDGASSGGSEMLRQALEGMGFDGVIDTTVVEKFGPRMIRGAYSMVKTEGMPGMTKDTVHFIAFEPTQLKSATGNSGAFDPADPNITRSASRDTYAWRESIDTSVGPLLQGEDFYLLPQREIAQDDFGDNGFAANGLMGHAERAVPGTRTIAYRIVGDNGIIGTLVSDVDPAGVLRSVHDIEITDRRSGAGSKVIATIAANTKSPIKIQDITDEADPFWTRIGVGYKDQYGDAFLDWEDVAQYLGARRAAQVDQDAAPAAGRGRGLQEGSYEVSELSPEEAADFFKFSKPRATETAAFKKWFGDSVVTDSGKPGGKPLVMYHGSRSGDITEFRQATYFTESPDEAGDYARSNAVYPVYISIENPYVASDESDSENRSELTEIDDAYAEQLAEDGYDGVVARRNGETLWAIPFAPNQVKSTTGNRGTFSRRSADITRSVARPAFYSQLQRAIEQVPDRIATMAAPQWKLWLDANASKLGIKKDEIEFSGVIEYLKQAGKEKVSSSEIAAYVEKNSPRTEALMRYADGATAERVAEDIGVSPTTVRRWVSWAGIGRSSAETKGVTDAKRAESMRLYKSGLSVAAVAEKLGLGTSTVHRIVRADGSSRSLQDVRDHDEEMRNDAISLYILGLNTYEAAAETGANQATVAQWVRDAGVSRGYSGAQALRSALGRGVTGRGIKASFTSSKGGGTMHAASVYELARMHQLETDGDVVSFARSGDRIPYGDGRTYVPDFEVIRADGSTTVEEIKPEPLLSDSDVQEKAAAAREFYSGSEKQYRLITERDIGQDGFDLVAPEDYPGDAERIKPALASARWAAREAAAATPDDITPAMREKVASGVPLFSKSRNPQVDTPEFRRWFGDSKVVDADGAPLVMYHGTAADFSAFDTSKGKPGVAEGAWFSSEQPSRYANGDGARVMPVYLSIKNPKVMDFANRGYDKAQLEAEGYDGVIDIGRSGRPYTAVAFRPEQIKSAAGNNGQFDPANPDITQSKGRTTGDYGREYTPQQLAMFKNTGRTVEKAPLIQRVKEARKDIWKKMAQGLVDQFRPIKDLGGNAYTLARLSKGSAGAFEALLNYGKLSIVDGAYDADMSGGFIKAVGEPLGAELEDFAWYVAANRAELLSAEDRENLFTPEDIAAGKSLAAGQMSRDYVMLDGSVTRDRAKAYADSLKKFNAFNKNVLDIAEQSGLIDGESRQFWENEFYVPFYRVSDQDGEFMGAKIKGGLARQRAFQELKGGSQKLNSDLLANTMQNWAHLIDASAKNRAAKATLEAAERLGVALESDQETVRQLGKSIGGKGGTVWFMDGGQQRHFLVGDPHLLTAINSLEYAGLRGPLMDALSATKHWLTVGVTASPAFKVRNLIRDSLQAISVSELSYNPIANLKDGIKASDRESQTYVSALASGGLIRFGTMLENNGAERVRRLVQKGVKPETILDSDDKLKAFYSRVIEPAVDAYNELGNRGEEINRAALFEQLKRQGMNQAEAALMARDLMDFSMQGTWSSVRFLTQVVPFLNARLQGLYKLGKGASENPQKFAVTTAAVALASIALLAAYHDDEDWKKREDWDRDGNWWFKVGGVAYRIPKPFEIGAIGTLAERGVELFVSDEFTLKRFLDRVKHIASDNLAMNPIPQAIKPMVDIYANKDSFSGRPIESMGMERLQAEYRYNAGTSMVSRAASTAMNSVTRNTIGSDTLSPVQIDSLLRGYFGWLGTFVIGGADMAIRPLTNEPARPQADYLKVVTQGIARQVPEPSSKYVSAIYDQAKILEQAYATHRQLVKEGKVEEAREFAADNREQLQRYKTVERVKQLQSDINKRIREIERGSMSPEDKRDAIQKLRDTQSKAAALVY